MGGSEYHLRKCALNSAGTGKSLKILKGKTEVTKCELSRVAQMGGPWWLTLSLFPQDCLPCATYRPRIQVYRIKPLSTWDGRWQVMSRGTVNRSHFSAQQSSPILNNKYKTTWLWPKHKTKGKEDRWWSIHKSQKKGRLFFFYNVGAFITRK